MVLPVIAAIGEGLWVAGATAVRTAPIWAPKALNMAKGAAGWARTHWMTTASGIAVANHATDGAIVDGAAAVVSSNSSPVANAMGYVGDAFKRLPGDAMDATLKHADQSTLKDIDESLGGVGVPSNLQDIGAEIKGQKSSAPATDAAKLTPASAAADTGVVKDQEKLAVPGVTRVETTPKAETTPAPVATAEAAPQGKATKAAKKAAPAEETAKPTPVAVKAPELPTAQETKDAVLNNSIARRLDGVDTGNPAAVGMAVTDGISEEIGKKHDALGGMSLGDLGGKAGGLFHKLVAGIVYVVQALVAGIGHAFGGSSGMKTASSMVGGQYSAAKALGELDSQKAGLGRDMTASQPRIVPAVGNDFSGAAGNGLTGAQPRTLINPVANPQGMGRDAVMNDGRGPTTYPVIEVRRDFAAANQPEPKPGDKAIVNGYEATYTPRNKPQEQAPSPSM